VTRVFEANVPKSKKKRKQSEVVVGTVARPGKKFFRDSNKLNFLIAKWLMMSGRPSTIADDVGFREVIEEANLNMKVVGRSGERRTERDIFNFSFLAVKRMLHSGWAFFKKPFLSLQGDGWTSQSRLAVFAVSATFFDHVYCRSRTVVLDICPLKNGKSADDLKTLLRRVLAKFGADPGWVMLTTTDGEKLLSTLFPNSSLMQTMRCALRTDCRLQSNMRLEWATRSTSVTCSKKARLSFKRCEGL